MTNTDKLIARGLLVLALIVVSIQGFTVVNDYGILWLKRVWRLRDHSAEARSAEDLVGRKAADFLAFIEDNVPSDSAVSVPLGSGTYLSMQNLLQFYLMPRGIPACPCDTKALDCPSQACVQCLASADSWVPTIGGFPPNRELSREKPFMPYEGAGSVFFRGVYGPGDTARVSEPPVPTRPMPIGLAIMIDTEILLMIVACGISLVALIKGRIGWIETASLGFPIGLGAWTLTTFVLSWAGLPLSRTAVILILLGLVILAQILVLLGLGNRRALPGVQLLRGTKVALRASNAPSIVLWSLVLALLGLATVA